MERAGARWASAVPRDRPERGKGVKGGGESERGGRKEEEEEEKREEEGERRRKGKKRRRKTLAVLSWATSHETFQGKAWCHLTPQTGPHRESPEGKDE